MQKSKIKKSTCGWCLYSLAGYTEKTVWQKQMPASPDARPGGARLTVPCSGWRPQIPTRHKLMYLHLVHPHPVQLLSSPFVHSILRHKPGSWKLWVWNDASLRALVTRHHGARAAAQFDACPGIIKADWGRYLVLYDHGGVYLDTDVFAVAPLDGLFDGGDEGAVWYAQSPALAPTMSNTATNYALASPAGKNVWLRASYEIQRRADSWLAKWAPFRSGALCADQGDARLRGGPPHPAATAWEPAVLQRRPARDRRHPRRGECSRRTRVEPLVRRSMFCRGMLRAAVDWPAHAHVANSRRTCSVYLRLSDGLVLKKAQGEKIRFFFLRLHNAHRPKYQRRWTRHCICDTRKARRRVGGGLSARWGRPRCRPTLCAQ